MDYELTPHAETEMQRRGICSSELALAMASADIRPGHGGRTVRQTVVEGYLIRAVVEHWRVPPRVVTVYRTSKLSKYGAV
jgi:hypothetical protein